ncbi:glycosyl transferase [Paractinoplanes deccanensis]|uniref:Glycosyl transferase n=1 Tax=Paractinoplanes deccanensis TaxID=113561 RepID=A0ABQ3YBX9_9ACTN|nr:glycosyltransferase [Actinoplanes deccanensis]GID77295.1 glycosyl transferase [Actinoplanes deccanensis]
MTVKTPPRPLRSRPRVSVVIPCYNYGHFLADCLRTVLDQPGVEMDVLIVDDASPDGSAAVARQLAEADPRVRLLAHETNKGHIATYNEGLAAAEGDYVVLLSADDVVVPGALAQSAALMEHNPGVGMVYGFAPTFVDVPRPARTQARSWTVWEGADWLAKVSRRGGNPIATPEVMLRTSLMRELGGYDPQLPHSADFLLWLRAAARAQVGRVNGADLAFYRVHGGNMHSSQFAGVLTDLSERWKAFEAFFAGDGALVPGSPALRAAAARAVAREALVTVRQAYENGSPAENAAELVALAERVDPTVRETRLFAHCSRLPGRSRGPLIPAPVTAAVDKAIFHARWRRWRHTGVLGAVRSL